MSLPDILDNDLTHLWPCGHRRDVGSEQVGHCTKCPPPGEGYEILELSMQELARLLGFSGGLELEDIRVQDWPSQFPGLDGFFLVKPQRWLQLRLKHQLLPRTPPGGAVFRERLVRFLDQMRTVSAEFGLEDPAARTRARWEGKE